MVTQRMHEKCCQVRGKNSNYVNLILLYIIGFLTQWTGLHFAVGGLRDFAKKDARDYIVIN